MNFLFAIHAPTYGGPHNQAVHFAKPLQQQGWTTNVVMPDEKGNAVARLREAGLSVHVIPLARLRATISPRAQIRFIQNFRRDVWMLRRVIRDSSIDLVVLPGLVNPHAALAARLEGIPIVWQIVDTRLPWSARLFFSALAGVMSDAVMSTGARVAAMHRAVNIRGQAIVTFYPPVDVAQFQPTPVARAKARQTMGVPASAYVVGMLGNINPMKGHRLFLELAAALRRLRSDVVFMWLGAEYPNHSAYRAELLTRARRLGLVVGKDLIISDPGGAANSLAQAFDVCWLTSDRRSEGIPTAVMEAMALSIPVVAVDVGSVRELVVPGTGFVVEHRHASDMVAITTTLLNDQSLRILTGKRARRQIVEACSLGDGTNAHLTAFKAAFLHKYGTIPAAFPSAAGKPGIHPRAMG